MVKETLAPSKQRSVTVKDPPAVIMGQSNDSSFDDCDVDDMEVDEYVTKPPPKERKPSPVVENIFAPMKSAIKLNQPQSEPATPEMGGGGFSSLRR